MSKTMAVIEIYKKVSVREEPRDKECECERNKGKVYER